MSPAVPIGGRSGVLSSIPGVEKKDRRGIAYILQSSHRRRVAEQVATQGKLHTIGKGMSEVNNRA